MIDDEYPKYIDMIFLISYFKKCYSYRTRKGDY